MNHVRRLFFLAVLTAAGLLGLQLVWIYKEWSRSRDLLQRQIDYAFQQAVDQEWHQRKDSMAAYLSGFLHDTSFVRFGTKYNEREKIWMTTLYDPTNPADYFSWSNKLYPVGEYLNAEQMEGEIDRFIDNNLKKEIANDVIFYFTQRFGKVWTKKQDELKLDTSILNARLTAQLTNSNVAAPFLISYHDTLRTKLVEPTGSALYSKPVLVNLNQVNDPEKRYVAVAAVTAPGMVILKRLWLIGTGSMLLVGLTFWCLWQMYKTIIRQKKLDNLKDDFISNMTHELKTPIATVAAAIDGLQFYDALHDKERAQRYLEISRNELNRLDGMVSKALEMSVEQNIGIDKERFAFRPFLEGLLAGFEVQSGFSWILSIEEGVMLYADKALFSSLFLNLVENAIKYGNGNTVMWIAAESRVVDKHTHGRDAAGKAGGSLQIIVSDNGPGIDKIYLPFVFDKFYRVPGTGQVKGFGLGLYRVASTVKAHGGTITVENADWSFDNKSGSELSSHTGPDLSSHTGPDLSSRRDLTKSNSALRFIITLPTI